MTLIDANLLLYAYDTVAPEHEKSRQWLEARLSGPEPVGLAWNTILAFVRIGTSPRILSRPLSLSDVVSVVDEWLAQPNVRILEAGERHWTILRGLLSESQIHGALVSAAHLAALAIEHGATLTTHDRDFMRFSGLRVEFPLASA